MCKPQMGNGIVLYIPPYLSFLILTKPLWIAFLHWMVLQPILCSVLHTLLSLKDVRYPLPLSIGFLLSLLSESNLQAPTILFSPPSPSAISNPSDSPITEAYPFNTPQKDGSFTEASTILHHDPWFGHATGDEQAVRPDCHDSTQKAELLTLYLVIRSSDDQWLSGCSCRMHPLASLLESTLLQHPFWGYLGPPSLWKNTGLCPFMFFGCQPCCFPLC